ncbi:hypothetical protein OG21DRAFT_1523826 [Imleria badia]|nr:hypothetical protein OG21DRAFT_1523826 [Imleria badia]
MWGTDSGRAGVEAMGDNDNDNEESRQGTPDEPPDKPYSEPRDLTMYRSNPEAGPTLNETRASHSKAQTQGSMERPQGCAETSGTRGRPRGHDGTRRLRRKKQRTSGDDDDVPRRFPDPQPPDNEAANRAYEPPNIKLEGEREVSASFDNVRTSNEADKLGALGHPEGARKWLKKLGDTKWEQKTDMGGLQTTQTSRVAKRPHQATSTASKDSMEAAGTSASSKQARHVMVPGQVAEWASGTSRGASRAIRTTKRNVENECDVEANAQSPDTWPGWPGVHGGKRVEDEGVKDSRRHQTMAKASESMGDDVERAAQRAAHAATGRNWRPDWSARTGQACNDIRTRGVQSASHVPQAAYRICRPTTSTRMTQDEAYKVSQSRTTDQVVRSHRGQTRRIGHITHGLTRDGLDSHLNAAVATPHRSGPAFDRLLPLDSYVPTNCVPDLHDHWPRLRPTNRNQLLPLDHVPTIVSSSCMIAAVATPHRSCHVVLLLVPGPVAFAARVVVRLLVSGGPRSPAFLTPCLMALVPLLDPWRALVDPATLRFLLAIFALSTLGPCSPHHHRRIWIETVKSCLRHDGDRQGGSSLVGYMSQTGVRPLGQQLVESVPKQEPTSQSVASGHDDLAHYTCIADNRDIYVERSLKEQRMTNNIDDSESPKRATTGRETRLRNWICMRRILRS